MYSITGVGGFYGWDARQCESSMISVGGKNKVFRKSGGSVVSAAMVTSQLLRSK